MWRARSLPVSPHHTPQWLGAVCICSFSWGRCLSQNPPVPLLLAVLLTGVSSPVLHLRWTSWVREWFTSSLAFLLHLFPFWSPVSWFSFSPKRHYNFLILFASITFWMVSAAFSATDSSWSTAFVVLFPPVLLLHRTLSALTLFPLLSLTYVVSHLLTHSSRTPVSSLDLILLSYLNYPSGSFPNLSFLVQDGLSPMPVFPVAGGISPSSHSSISLLPATSYPEPGLALSPENRFFLQPPFSTGAATILWRVHSKPQNFASRFFARNSQSVAKTCHFSP